MSGLQMNISENLNYQENKLFITKRSDEIASLVDAATFIQGGEGHIVTAPASDIALKIPEIANLPLDHVQIQRPVGMPAHINGFMERLPYPAITLSRLHNVACLPGGLAIAQGNIVLKDCFTSDWSTDFHPLLTQIPDGRYQPQADCTPRTILSGKFIYLDYMHQNHYGHFIVDVLSKAWAYHYCTDYLKMADVSVLLTKSTAKFIPELLVGYGIPKEAIVWLEEPALVQELLVPKRSFMIQEYTTPVAGGIWRRLRDGYDRRSGGSKRVYISRSHNPQRILVNEHSVEDIFRKEGFHIAHPQDLSIAEQVDIVANAELIAGASGSNMFNLAFQRKLKSAFIFASPNLVHYHDVFFNEPYSSKIRYFIGEIDTGHEQYNPHNVHTPWKLPDLDAFAQAVRQWIADTEATTAHAPVTGTRLPSLDDIGFKHGTDKSSRHHNFLDFYERFVGEMRFDEMTILEIGVNQGQSMAMWLEYFPNARFVGLDTNRECLRLASGRARIEIVDQSDPIALTDIARRFGPFGLVIDDGSHYWSDQITAFQYLFPHVAPGGYYILEDLDTSYGQYRNTYKKGDIPAAQYLHRVCDFLVGNQAMTEEEAGEPFVRSCAAHVEFMAYFPRTSLFRRKIR
ncbi:glycosyltransferase 61 family protein [Azospirillum tabaci]|uniref:glycosyltransferase 61 family protein n=1 Tax=Azospirillum tabaci TaxID=2752310 RepID=UPI0016607176|nr:glycosyltransferase 61 family protein [Azospirillum tabaci]